MTLPTGYADEDALATYMDGVLGTDADFAQQLNWSVAGGDYNEAVYETMFAYGTDDLSSISGMSNIRYLRALARRELWQLVMQRTGDRVDSGGAVEGGGVSNSQLYQHAKEQYRLAEAAAAQIARDIVTTTTRPTVFARVKGRRGS